MVAEALLRITYAKSAIGYGVRQKATIRSLGLRHLGETVVQPDNAAIRGMIHSVCHLVVVEPLTNFEVRGQEGGDGDGA